MAWVCDKLRHGFVTFAMAAHVPQAPEVLAKKGYRGGPADIWSLGERGVVADGAGHATLRRLALRLSNAYLQPVLLLRFCCTAGVVLYVVLAGCLPFDEDDLPTLFAKVRNHAVVLCMIGGPCVFWGLGSHQQRMPMSHWGPASQLRRVPLWCLPTR